MSKCPLKVKNYCSILVYIESKNGERKPAFESKMEPICHSSNVLTAFSQCGSQKPSTWPAPFPRPQHNFGHLASRKSFQNYSQLPLQKSIKSIANSHFFKKYHTIFPNIRSLFYILVQITHCTRFI